MSVPSIYLHYNSKLLICYALFTQGAMPEIYTLFYTLPFIFLSHTSDLLNISSQLYRHSDNKQVLYIKRMDGRKIMLHR